MTYKFKREQGDWVQYRSVPALMEVDLHWSDGEPTGAYWENMERVREVALRALVRAQEDRFQFVSFLIPAWTQYLSGFIRRRAPWNREGPGFATLQ
jgi:hypothetical protein